MISRGTSASWVSGKRSFGSVGSKFGRRHWWHWWQREGKWWQGARAGERWAGGAALTQLTARVPRERATTLQRAPPSQ